jgi:hypothetical protein
MAPHRPNATTYLCKATGKQIEGAAGPPSRARRVSRTGVGGAASRGWHRPRRIVPHSGRDGFPPRELVRQDRGASPRRMISPHCYGQSIKCPYPRTGSGACAPDALERGRACSRAARTLERGGARSRGSFSLESRLSPLEGGVRPRARRSLLEGIFKWAVGAVRVTVAWAMPRVVKRGAFGFGLLRVLSGDSPVV